MKANKLFYYLVFVFSLTNPLIVFLGFNINTKLIDSYTNSAELSFSNFTFIIWMIILAMQLIFSYNQIKETNVFNKRKNIHFILLLICFNLWVFFIIFGFKVLGLCILLIMLYVLYQINDDLKKREHPSLFNRNLFQIYISTISITLFLTFLSILVDFGLDEESLNGILVQYLILVAMLVMIFRLLKRYDYSYAIIITYIWILFGILIHLFMYGGSNFIMIVIVAIIFYVFSIKIKV